MIDWVHELLKDWGRYMRRTPTGWATRSVVGRVMEEGPVVSSGSQHIPRGVGVPAGLVDITRAIILLPYDQRAALTIRYCTASKRELAWALKEADMKRSTMYVLADQAGSAISMWFILKEKHR